MKGEGEALKAEEAAWAEGRDTYEWTAPLGDTKEGLQLSVGFM